MKITKRQLKKIIKEYKAKMIREAMTTEEKFENAGIRAREMSKGPDMPGSGGSLLDLDDYEDLYVATDRFVEQQTSSGYTRQDIIEALRNILEEL